MLPAFMPPVVAFELEVMPSSSCMPDRTWIPSRLYRLLFAMRRRVIWMPTIAPVSSRGGGRRARPARGRRRCRGRPGADLRAACGAMPPCPGGARGHDGLRVASGCVLGSRLGGGGRGADRSGAAWSLRVRIGSRRATVRPCPARAFPLASHRDVAAVPICGHDMKMAATVFRWRPFCRVFACCRLYAFLSARRS